jgi:hypothetical protein
MRTASNSTQRCKICGARLSLYNDDILCFSCQEKEHEQTFMKESHKPLRGKIVINPININVNFKNHEQNKKRLIFSKIYPI